jgi:hypothetical protein
MQTNYHIQTDAVENSKHTERHFYFNDNAFFVLTLVLCSLKQSVGAMSRANFVVREIRILSSLSDARLQIMTCKKRTATRLHHRRTCWEAALLSGRPPHPSHQHNNNNSGNNNGSWLGLMAALFPTRTARPLWRRRICSSLGRERCLI